MALGRRRARRVLDRVRSMTPRALRRLLLVGGLALAGWLLSGAGQAHAAAGDGLDPGAVIGSLPHAGVPVKTLAPGHAGRLASIAARPRAITGHGIAQSVIGTAVRSGDLVRRTGALDPVAVLRTGRVGTGASRAPRHHVGGTRPGDPAASGRHDQPRNSAVRHRVASPATPVSAPGTGRCGCAPDRTAPAAPAPLPGFPRGAAGAAGALPSAVGSASAQGLAGHAGGPEVAPQPSRSLRSVLGAVPPAAHTATDEPAVSPD